jgi:hypothetical protein
LTGPTVYDNASGWDTAGMTLFQDADGASATINNGVLQLDSGSSTFMCARLDTCPPMADFEAVLTGVSSCTTLAFHQNYWSNTASSVTWYLYFYSGVVYLYKGTGTDTGSTALFTSANSSASTFCVRVTGDQLTVYASNAASGTPVLQTTLDAFTDAGQFALGTVGGTATLGALTIRQAYPLGTYIQCSCGLARTLLPIGRVMSAAVLPPLLPHLVQRPVRTRANYALSGGNANAQQNQTGRIRGTVQHKDVPANTPVYRRVRLYRTRDGLLVGQQWSDPATGAYDFQWVESDQVYTVVADDYAGNWRAVIADQLKPEPMS